VGASIFAIAADRQGQNSRGYCFHTRMSSKLRAQATVATDEGFEALSRSRTLESFWGATASTLAAVDLPRCPNYRRYADLA
jgi:hypothetical protein